MSDLVETYSWFTVFFEKYGYWIVFLGAMFEGESIILAASAMAYAGTLSITNVIFLSFLGSMISDQVSFIIGRKFGEKFLQRFPKFAKHRDKVIGFLKKYQNIFIFGFRFVYGIRNVTPFIIGSTDIPSKKFFFLNAGAAFVWAFISCMIGYYLGEIILSMSNLSRFILLGSVGFIFVAVFLWKFFKNKSKRAK